MATNTSNGVSIGLSAILLYLHDVNAKLGGLESEGALRVARDLGDLGLTQTGWDLRDRDFDAWYSAIDAGVNLRLGLLRAQDPQTNAHILQVALTTQVQVSSAFTTTTINLYFLQPYGTFTLWNNASIPSGV